MRMIFPTGRPLRMLLTSVLCSAVLCGAIGCETIQEYNKMQDLQDTLDAYTLYIEWSDYDNASLYRSPGQPPNQYANIKKLKKYHVTSYEVKRQVLMSGGNQMDRDVEIGYYKLNEMNVKSMEVQEVWTYDEFVQKWYLKTPLPNFE